MTDQSFNIFKIRLYPHKKAFLSSISIDKMSDNLKKVKSVKSANINHLDGQVWIKFDAVDPILIYKMVNNAKLGNQWVMTSVRVQWQIVL